MERGKLSTPGALVFVGFMGAGKTTATRALARERGATAIDTDDLIEQRLGHTIAEEFERHGEASFRRVEEQVICELLERAGPDEVISLGGGSVLSCAVRKALKGHTTVLLDVDRQTAWKRAGRRRRPLANDRDAFYKLHASRQALYESVADAILPADLRSRARSARGALTALQAAGSGVRMLWATSASGAYPVFVGAGVLDRDVWPETSRRIVVSDAHVAPLYGARCPDVLGTITIEAGERHKTLASAELVWEQMVALGATRADQLVAIGGGVVGDLGGFCAATYQRGIEVVQVPTTLVAQVDSAYGGKTGVDLAAAKNYVGAYHQPSAVLVDPQTLTTLPAAEVSAGYAEVLKTALIAGGELWRAVSADEPLNEATIFGCARLKLSVVAADERDGGRRQVLNLGHTVGHAIETVTGFKRFRHGEAVALGMLAALRLSEQPQLREQVRELLIAHDLPTTVRAVDVQEVVAAVELDKKRIGAEVPFVLVQSPGDVTVGHSVQRADLLAAVQELAQ